VICTRIVHARNGTHKTGANLIDIVRVYSYLRPMFIQRELLMKRFHQPSSSELGNSCAYYLTKLH
jgi:hypothetical protein